MPATRTSYTPRRSSPLSSYVSDVDRSLSPLTPLSRSSTPPPEDEPVASLAVMLSRLHAWKERRSVCLRRVALRNNYELRLRCSLAAHHRSATGLLPSAFMHPIPMPLPGLDTTAIAFVPYNFAVRSTYPIYFSDAPIDPADDNDCLLIYEELVIEPSLYGWETCGDWPSDSEMAFDIGCPQADCACDDFGTTSGPRLFGDHGPSLFGAPPFDPASDGDDEGDSGVPNGVDDDGGSFASSADEYLFD
jgi:hypothetical protein